MLCIDARHARAALSLRRNKTDADDALGLAQIMRAGWYREVAVEGRDCQALRTCGRPRELVSQIATLKKCARGILKAFGRVLRTMLRASCIRSVQEVVEGDAVLEPIVLPMLKPIAAQSSLRYRGPWRTPRAPG